MFREIQAALAATPLWVRGFFAVAGFLMGMFAERLPEAWQDVGLFAAFTFGLIGIIGVILHIIKHLTSRTNLPFKDPLPTQPEFKLISSDPSQAPTPSGQLADATLHATGVLHGGKLELLRPRGNEDQRFYDRRETETARETDILIAIYNNDFHETVDDVSVTLVSYGPAEDPSIRFPAGIELECTSASRNVHPRSRRFFKLAHLEDSKELRLTRSRQAWLGNKDNGIILKEFPVLLKVSCSGRNHSEKSEFFEVEKIGTDFLQLGPPVKR